MTLVDLMSRFSDEDCCRDLLERLRWPIAPKCIRCQGDVSRRGAILICYACHYEFRVTTGTIFGDTKLPLETWFLAVLLLCEARKGMSANQLKRTIGVSYKTAWYLCHRIRFAMATAARPPLTGTVELDETYVTNTVESAFSLLKHGIVGSCHKVSAKHLSRYLAEMEFRFNRRKGYDVFTETLRHMVNCDPLSFAELVR